MLEGVHGHDGDAIAAEGDSFDIALPCPQTEEANERHDSMVKLTVRSQESSVIRAQPAGEKASVHASEGA